MDYDDIRLIEELGETVAFGTLRKDCPRCQRARLVAVGGHPESDGIRLLLAACVRTRSDVTPEKGIAYYLDYRAEHLEVKLVEARFHVMNPDSMACNVTPHGVSCAPLQE